MLGRINFYRVCVLDVDLAAPAVFTFSTELPDAGMNVARQVTLPATSGRQPVMVKLPGTAKGRYGQAQLAPTGEARLYGIVCHVKRAGEATETTWTWTAGPVEPTPESWMDIKLPIPPTPEEWIELPLPIPPSAELHEWANLPVDE